MRRETSSDREAWTCFVEGHEAKTDKYSAIREGAGGAERPSAVRPPDGLGANPWFGSSQKSEATTCGARDRVRHRVWL
jgi:hypothetical protein